MEVRDGVADGGEHPLHLVLASLVEDELDAAPAKAAGACGSGAAIVELQAVAEPP